MIQYCPKSVWRTHLRNILSSIKVVHFFGSGVHPGISFQSSNNTFTDTYCTIQVKKTACYDIDVEVDDNLKNQMSSFLLSTNSQQDIQNLDSKIHETVETINSLKTNREFYLSFAKDPQHFMHKWLLSQNRDLKQMTDVVGCPEEERRAQFYHQSWTPEAVNRYFFLKIQQKRAELEQALGIRNN